MAAELVLDLNEVLVEGSTGLSTGFKGFLQKNRRGAEIGATISEEEYGTLENVFKEIVEEMYNARTLADVKNIQEKLQNNEGVQDVELVIGPSTNLRNIVTLTWHNLEMFIEEDFEIYAKFSWYLLLPEGEI